MKGIDHVIRKTAIDLDLPEDQVKPIVMAYWEAVFHRLVKLKSTTITVRHVGVFTVSRFKLNNYIRKRIDKIRKTQENLSLSDTKKIEILAEDTAKLKVALVQRNILAKQYAEAFGNV